MEIKQNTDKPMSEDYNEWDISLSSAQEMIDRGYPVLYTDAWALAERIYNSNFNKEHNGKLNSGL